MSDYVHGSATNAKNGFRLAVGIVDRQSIDLARKGPIGLAKKGPIGLAKKGLSDEEVEDVLEGDSGSGVVDLWQIKAFTSSVVQGKRK